LIADLVCTRRRSCLRVPTKVALRLQPLPGDKGQPGIADRSRAVARVLCHAIKDRVSIHERPKNVEARTEGGHWKGDLIICKRTRPVLVLHERKSRVTLAARLAGKTAAETISVMLAVFARIQPALRKSITFDNDTAFAQHALLRIMRAMTTWFCDAYASWQKGGVENANGRLRRFLEGNAAPLRRPLAG
jgi:IS30 family transposase